MFAQQAYSPNIYSKPNYDLNVLNKQSTDFSRSFSHYEMQQVSPGDDDEILPMQTPQLAFGRSMAVQAFSNDLSYH